MGIFNEIETTHTSGSGKRGKQGPQGIGFKLTSGDYDIQNEKLTNVEQGTDPNDAVIKSQIQLVEGAQPGTVINDKAVIYIDTGSVHVNSIYLQDTPDSAGNTNEVRLLTEHQSYKNIHLTIPDSGNNDGYGGRPKSTIMVSSVDQTIAGKKSFQNIEVSNPSKDNHATNKGYVDTNYLNKNGGILLGPLSMNKNDLIVIPGTPKFSYLAVIRNYVESEIAKIPALDTSDFIKKDGSVAMTADFNAGNHRIINVADADQSELKHAVNVRFVSNTSTFFY